VRVLIVVASQTGRTARMAEAVAEGAREAGAEVTLRRAEEAQASDLIEADAVILGSGVHMAGVESSMAAFLERTAPAWLAGHAIGKLGAAFVSGGMGGRGGAELVLVSLLATLAEHGMLLVPMHSRLEGFRAGGCHWGPLAWTTPRARVPGPTDEHLAAARAHGRWVAECTQRWLTGKPG
jgi:NAD(P)H dehydrogenase (quinone)